MPKADRMKTALNDLAEITGDTTITSRDPLSSLSFSCLPPEIVKSQMDALQQYRNGLQKAISPLGSDGKPVRKYAVYCQLLPYHLTSLIGIPTGNQRIGSMEKKMAYQSQVRELVLVMNHCGCNSLGLCTSGTSFLPPERPRESERPEKILHQDPTFDGWLRRPASTPNSLDKLVIKGSMVKVVGNTPTPPFQRLLI